MDISTINIKVTGDVPEDGGEGQVLTRKGGKPVWADLPGGGGGGSGTGEKGGYYKPTVSADGDLSWTPSDSAMPPVEATNIKGPQGETGPEGKQGPKGSDANVTIENIKNALGYTPADAEKVEQLSEEIGDVQFHTAMPEGVVGDGVTDDSQAIQALLDAHDYVYLPKGTYHIRNSWLNMTRDNVTFICDGTLIINTTQALVLSASHCNVKIAHIKAKYNGSWNETDRWKFTVSAVKLHATSASVMYNTIEVGLIDRCVNGFWLVPDGASVGIAHNTIKFDDVLAERGIYFNPGDQEYVFINSNHFYGGQLRGNHPIYTQKGAGQTDPFNGNTFNHIAMEGCQKPMTLNCFYMNKFSDMRLAETENAQIPYPDPLIVFDGESFGNVVETHTTLNVDRIVDPEKTSEVNWEKWLGNQYIPKVLIEGEASVNKKVGLHGQTSFGYMVIKDGYNKTIEVKNKHLDLSNDKYVIVGRTFLCIADSGNAIITLPKGYRQRVASEFYVYAKSITSPYTIKVMQEGVDIIPDTVITEPGLYKAELYTGIGWIVTKADIVHHLPEESLPEMAGETTD